MILTAVLNVAASATEWSHVAWRRRFEHFQDPKFDSAVRRQMSSPARKVALMVAACPEDPSQAVDPRGQDAGKVDGVKPRAEHEEDTLPFVDRAASEASFRAP